MKTRTSGRSAWVRTAAILAGSIVLASSGLASAATTTATVVITNLDAGTGAGLDDATPRAPLASNAGTTLGEQRLNAVVFAAAELAALLECDVPIEFEVTFTDRGCDAGGALLGTAGSVGGAVDNPALPESGTLYPQALANCLAGSDLNGETAEISANFNLALDDPGCLDGKGWCYDLSDGGCAEAGVPLHIVVQHELIHGAGFATFINKSPSASAGDLGSFPDVPGIGLTPDIWSVSAYSLAAGKTWADATRAERAASITAPNGLAWSGANVATQAPTFLTDIGGQLQGTDPTTGMMLLHSPDPITTSSVSHWTTAAAPNLLMEPVIEDGLQGGEGLWLALLEDLGWNSSAVSEPEPEAEPEAEPETEPETDSTPTAAASASGSGKLSETGACAVSPVGATTGGGSALLLAALALFGIRRRRH